LPELLRFDRQPSGAFTAVIDGSALPDAGQPWLSHDAERLYFTPPSGRQLSMAKRQADGSYAPNQIVFDIGGGDAPGSVGGPDADAISPAGPT